MTLGEDDGTYVTVDENACPLSSALSDNSSMIMHPNSIINFFLLARWIDRNLNSRLSLKVFLPSFPFVYYKITVAKGGLSVIVQVRIPSEVLNVEALNASLYRNEDKSAKYGEDHFKTIADKNTVKALQGIDPSAKVYLQQVIDLPFKCNEKFVALDGLEGKRYKIIESDIKIAVCELIAADSVGNIDGKMAEEEEDEYEEVTYHGAMSTTSTYRPNVGAASVISINPENGKLRKKFVGTIPGIPTEVTADANKESLDFEDLLESSWYAGMAAEGKLAGLDFSNLAHITQLRELYKQYQASLKLKRRRTNDGLSVCGTVMSSSVSSAAAKAKAAVAAAEAQARAHAAALAHAAAVAQGVAMAQAQGTDTGGGTCTGTGTSIRSRSGQPKDDDDFSM